eukprot:TRINITY_DN9104_c0_g1_i1.p1 TRINITY_DN9104_c0_g1~~TRINITY_DN9104_c0_g1_i1.p1  ORF type:complete len:241 (-),score=43.92 TRINITY_DN9104_c0_g1_i1:307-1029(-)
MSEQIEKAQASKAEAEAKGLHLGKLDTAGIAMGGAGQGGGLGLNAPGHGPEVKHFAGGGGGAVIEVDPEISKSWALVQDDANSANWIVCTYTENGKGLNLKEVGQSGMTGFKEALGDDLAWGGLRIAAVDKRGGTVCKRPKLIFVQWKGGKNAGTMRKAKMASHKGTVKQAIASAHIDLVIEDSLDEMNANDLIPLLQKATGSHKPNGYEFDEGDFIEADYYGLGIGEECKGETATGNAD